VGSPLLFSAHIYCMIPAQTEEASAVQISALEVSSSPNYSILRRSLQLLCGQSGLTCRPCNAQLSQFTMPNLLHVIRSSPSISLCINSLLQVAKSLQYTVITGSFTCLTLPTSKSIASHGRPSLPALPVS
ncbi:hypothetical protein MIR68_002942, partial [Amoeboaphelidium protococcarum]